MAYGIRERFCGTAWAERTRRGDRGVFGWASLPLLLLLMACGPGSEVTHRPARQPLDVAFREPPPSAELVPLPKEVEELPGPGLALRSPVILSVDEEAGPVERQAAEEIAMDLRDLWGLRARTGLPEEADIVLSRVGGPDRAESYLLSVDEKRATVRGPGVYWGAQTLKQLIERHDGGVRIRPVVVRDWPSLGFRGVHMTGGRHAAFAVERLTTRILSPLKLNALVLEGLPPAEAPRLAQIARRHQVEVVARATLPGEVAVADQADGLRHLGRSLAAHQAPGLLQVARTEEALTSDVVTGPEFPTFANCVVAAESAWNAGEGNLAREDFRPERWFLRAWNRSAKPAPPRAGQALDLSGLVNSEDWRWALSVSFAPSDHAPSARAGDPLPRGVETFADTTFRVDGPVLLHGESLPKWRWPTRLDLDLDGAKAGAVAFLWGLTGPAEVKATALTVRLRYLDGSEETAPVRVRREIFDLGDPSPGVEAVEAWRGSGPAGRKARLHRWIWTNPHPSRPIDRLVLETHGLEPAPVLFGITLLE